MQTKRIPKNRHKRMFNLLWRQKARTPICPMEPSLQGKTVVLTGGNAGIGLEVAKGLIERKAKVIILSRDEEKSNRVINGLTGDIHFVKLDLGNMDTISSSVKELAKVLGDNKIDILINNAGIVVSGNHRLSPQGYELTFAVNVLGHHVFFKECVSNFLLTDKAHIIAVTGDIYIMANDCTPDFHYENGKGGMSYARSKLGVMWWAKECGKRYANYKVNLVHPGVVPAGLGAKDSFKTRILSTLLLSPKGGAQMTLICATQPDIENGAYYLNTYGKGILPDDDIAQNSVLAEKFWDRLESICEANFNKK